MTMNTILQEDQEGMKIILLMSLMMTFTRTRSELTIKLLLKVLLGKRKEITLYRKYN